MEIKLWGVRGSLPTPMQAQEIESRLLGSLQREETALKKADADPEKILESLPESLQHIVGGETTCVEVLCGGQQLVFDAGSGIRRLGYDMMSHPGDHPRGTGTKEINTSTSETHILLTHTHWDHMQGWPFFLPAFDPGRTIHFYSCIENLEERFTHQQKNTFASHSFHDSASKKVFHYVDPGSAFKIGTCDITTQKLLHPGGSVSYKVQAEGKTFIFATDTEFYGPELSQLISEYHGFFHDADMMVMDAQYSLPEAELKKGWGHTAMTIAVDCCIHWNIRKLILTHHEPAHEDDTTYDLYEKAMDYLAESKQKNLNLEIFLARQDDVHYL